MIIIGAIRKGHPLLHSLWVGSMVAACSEMPRCTVMIHDTYD